ncbi:type II toxin-antitoxin system RelB/DinJ family antitoxin [Patescibacteria group bacterium AH-259-L07]|nr:type II toxin-antitoxin system RelB/DinJ family antitoxin [Patescibacteria group bacterium AH-259-L07]
MKTVINIKTDKEIKIKAQKIAKELGLPLSTVVNAYLKEFVRERSVRFSVEPEVRPEVGKLLKQASKDYKERKNIRGPFITADEAIKHLHS